MDDALQILLLVQVSVGSTSSDSNPKQESGYSALCVVGKDENQYIPEWLDYHKCIGAYNKVFAQLGFMNQTK